MLVDSLIQGVFTAASLGAVLAMLIMDNSFLGKIGDQSCGVFRCSLGNANPADDSCNPRGLCLKGIQVFAIVAATMLFIGLVLHMILAFAAATVLKKYVRRYLKVVHSVALAMFLLIVPCFVAAYVIDFPVTECGDKSLMQISGISLGFGIYACSVATVFEIAILCLLCCRSTIDSDGGFASPREFDDLHDVGIVNPRTTEYGTVGGKHY